MRKFILLFFIPLIISACGTKKQVAVSEPDTTAEHVTLSEVVISPETSKNEEKTSYKASRTKVNDLVHTRLDLSFDFTKKTAFGNAQITLKPHYYPVSSVQLDARGFKISKIVLLNGKNETPLDYQYQNNIITITLNKTYKRNETYTVSIDYTASPDDLPKGGFWAITDTKGLYFIDTDTNNPQLWTQGETQSNSAWFPTIDAPNQKTTQDIYLTVPRDYQTLSNGELYNQLLNDDGTRTDHWRQTKPHAPYLVMIAVGKYEILEDYWRDMPVFTYVEKGDEEQAKKLFAKTDKMIEFFSDKLDYDYPWDKYHQIVVRDFVSGAMENTSATVFGDYVLRFENEQQRRENENVVSHELSHHWFGDLVTCESWANLPLNESFATYFEYLWIEHEYGRFDADLHLQADNRMYMFEAMYKNEDLIRFHYEHRDDMFDMHSYQKGSSVLHYLRKVVGDDAFWDALELYLKTNEYKAVEIHNLRLAFEEVTGQDLNWFFNQFFLNKGYPDLDIQYDYSNTDKIQTIKTIQKQNQNKAPIYKLPVKVDFYFPDTVIRKDITLTKQEQIFNFKFDTKPQLVIFDAQNGLFGKKKEHKTTKEFIIQLERAPYFRDINDALEALKDAKASPELNAIYLKLLDRSYVSFRKRALEKINITADDVLYPEYQAKLKQLAENDPDKSIRSRAKAKLK